MTFSDSRIVEALKRDWTPVWESVSPVKEVSFDLGEGREVKGTVGGEIAIYFCDEKGQVFDILPALQSPAATLNAMNRALEFYKSQQGVMTSKGVRSYHLDEMRKVLEVLDAPMPETKELYLLEQITDGIKLDFKSDPEDEAFLARVNKIDAAALFPGTAENEEQRDKRISAAIDGATRDLREMTGSKVRMYSYSEGDVTVVEPGGRGYYEWQVHLGFCGKDPGGSALDRAIGVGAWSSKLKQPKEWESPLFTGILHQQLGGGKFRYNSESLEAISLIEE